jgi:acyl-CoA synthetase (AMP-forming)/AMP-acid ligase II/acyl carrier protein
VVGYGGFVETVAANAARTPGKRAVVFCRGGRGDGYTSQELSYGDLDAAARATAAWLRGRLQPGDRALLLYPQGLAFVTSFLGCLYAGVLPVAAPLPTEYKNRANRTVEVARDARASIVLTDSESLPGIREWLSSSGLAATVSAAAQPAQAADLAGSAGLAAAADPGYGAPPEADGQRPAFLQYTSGSTSAPRGVTVSYANLEDNIQIMRDARDWQDGPDFCSWLPVHHDMGLVMKLLTPLYLGSTVILMAPTDFLLRPRLWLSLISDYGVAVSGAPNFAYDLCARRLTDAQVGRLDLSGWRCAVNGAEPVAAATLARFADRFGPAGFRAESFAPGYGLAEATLCVSFASPDRAPLVRRVDPAALARHEICPARPGAPAQLLVVCGPVRAQELRIVDPATREVLPAGQVGEIWVGGDSVTQGYWRQPEETERVFGAVTDGGEGPFLRTGDLGAVQDGELFVTGRIKEMMIIHGRNLYPHDIEREVRALDPALADRVCCVFSVPVPEEQIVVVQEVRASGLDGPALADLAGRIRRGVWDAVGVRAANVVFVKVGRVTKTTSGKLQRTAISELFRSGELDVIYEDLDSAARARFRAPAATVSPDAISAWLTERVAFYLERSAQEIDQDAPFVEIGLDSVYGMTLCGEAEDEFGCELDPALAWEHPTITRLAGYVGAELASRR